MVDDPKRQTTRADKGHQPSNNNIFSLLLGWAAQSMFDNKETANQQTERHHQEKITSDRKMFWAIIFYSVVTTGIFFAALYQSSVSSDAELRQLRAYIIVTDFGVFCPACGDTTPVPNPLLKNSIQYRIENSGQTPAYQVHTVTNWIPVNDVSPNATLPQGFAFPDHPILPGDFNGESDIGRDHHKDVGGPIPADQISVFHEAVAGHQTLFIYGHIDYCDVFRLPHSTEYCFKYFPNGGTLQPTCDRHTGEIPTKRNCNQQ